MTAILDLPVETKADLAEATARLYSLIHPAPAVSDAVLDGLQRVCAWGREYLAHPDTVHRHFVQDAGADLEEAEPRDDVETELIAAALRVCALVSGESVGLPPQPCRPARKPDAPKPGRKPGGGR